MILENLYDSHTHFQPTGEVLLGLDLRSLKTRKDLQSLPLNPEYLRGEWLHGFGWDENDFTDLVLNKKTLDQFFPDRPVLLSRVDGHSSWLNSAALKKLGLESDSGILKEKDHIEALLSLPDFSKKQKINFLKKAIQVFNSQGFTHIRDMGSTEDQFLLAKEIEEAGELTLLVVHNFVCENLKDFDRAMAEALRCKNLESDLLKVAGLKFYYDGSLGSDTALLSQPYEGKTEKGYGLVNWNDKDLASVIKKTWEQGFEVSVHTIGDEAAHRVVQIARKIYSEGVSGPLNLEHAEVLRPDTIQAMKSLHVTCHIQPCHWLSDNKWLEKKLTTLFRYAFPWEALRLAKIPFFFGSDAPIEPVNLFSNLRALEESQKYGIRKLGDDPLKYHVNVKYRLTDTYTKISNFEITEVFFRGKKII
jgi:predicted amidohydrolase YtcJ